MLTRTMLKFGLALAALPAVAGPPTVTGPVPSNTVEFVANRQQWEKPVLFAADVPSGRLFLEQGRLVQALYDGKQLEELHHHSANVSSKQQIKAHAYSTTFVGASSQAKVQGETQLPGYSNYFLGDDQSRWASNVPGYGEVRYQDLYPGIGLHFYSKARVLEYDFELAAGADARRIVLRYDGQTQLRVVDGALHIGTSVGTVVEQRPYAYQQVNGKRQRVSCEYALSGGNTVTFSLPKGYDHTLPLVIDPVLVYSSYTNSSNNYGYTAAFDSVGNLYAGGSVFGTGYPTTVGAFQVNHNSGIDMGIIKYNPSALTGPASRVYATYVGGSSDDHPHSLVVDRNNNLIIMGSTGSSNYPTTVGAFARTFGGGTADIVVTKLNAAGSALVGSTFLGGSGLDGRVPTGALNVNYGDTYRGDVTVDRNNNIYVASASGSANFPTTVGSFQRTLVGGSSDGVVTKLAPNLTSLVWSSFLGGSGIDMVYSVQVDSVNNVFVSGGTTSTNFPTTAGAFHSTYQGGAADGFVARIAPAGNAIINGTYIGTSAYDQAYFLQLNLQGEVYTYGQTAGSYPVSPGVYANAGSRQFIQKLNPALSTSVFSTVIGNGPGSGENMSPTAFLVDNCGQMMLSGWTSQGGMPVTSDALQATGGSGTGFNSIGAYFYIAQISSNARRLVYGTYFGNGNCHVDGGTSRFDKRGIIYQSMCAGSGNNAVTTTPNAWSRTNGSGYNNAAFKIDVAQLNATFFPSIIPTNNPQLTQRILCAPANFVFNRQQVAGTGARWDFGNGQTSTQSNGVPVTYSTAGKYTVRLTVYDSTSCMQSTSFVDTVRVLGLPRAAAGVDQTICPGGSATLTIGDTGPRSTYTWLTTTGLNTTTGRTVIATPSATTRYVVRIDIPGAINCTSYDTVMVNVRQPLAVAFTPVSATGTPQRQGCAPLALSFRRDTPQTGDSLRWDFGDGTSSTSPGTATNPVNHVYTRPGRYAVRLQVSDAATCPVRLLAVDTVTVYAVPSVNVGVDQSICLGTSAVLTASDTGIPGTVYAWSPAAGLSTTTGRRVAATPSATTTYYLTVTSPGGCTDRDTLVVRVSPQPTATATASTRQSFTNAPVTFSNTSANATTYAWDFGDGQTSTEAAPTHTFAQPGNYSVRLTSSSGGSTCFDQTTMNILVKQFELPNIVTPNNDGKNDTFRPFVSFEPVSLKIYNRWGREVYSRNGYTDGWGDANTPAGIYYYYLTGADGATWKGWLEVVR